MTTSLSLQSLLIQHIPLSPLHLSYSIPLYHTHTLTISHPLTRTRSHPLFLSSHTEGRSALQEINKKMGLGFDDWDLDFYTKMFQEQLKRNPTDVECFDLGTDGRVYLSMWCRPRMFTRVLFSVFVLSCGVEWWGGVWCGVVMCGVEWSGVVSFDVFISMHIATPLHYLSRSSFLLLAAYCHL